MHRTSALRGFIRQILSEEAGPGKIDQLIDRMVGLNAQLQDAGAPLESVVTVFNDGAEVEVFYSWRVAKPDGSSSVARAYPQHLQLPLLAGSPEKIAAIRVVKANPHPFGSILIIPADPSKTGPCLGSHVVQLTRSTRSGWGPLLYDVAMEVASQRGSGLTPDRFDVSSDALRVWDIYDNSRPDVQSRQLDISLDATELDDDELELAAETQITPEDPSDDCGQNPAWGEEDEEWAQSPLSRTYSKGTAALARLEAEGLLVMA